MKIIEHNLEVAKPMFAYFIKNMSSELAQWIQYKGAEVDGSRLYFKFKSSQNSLSFKVYAGVNVGDVEMLLNVNSNDIYNYFREIKYNIINQSVEFDTLL
jgi:hypothetical protein